jgi:hypothetical protein
VAGTVEMTLLRSCPNGCRLPLSLLLHRTGLHRSLDLFLVVVFFSPAGRHRRSSRNLSISGLISILNIYFYWK